MRKSLSLCGSALATLFSVMSLSSCAGSRASGWVVPQPPPSATRQKLHVIGTVQYVDLEGGLFVIRDAQGVQYNPTNLPQAFRRDGMLVEAEAQRRDDIASIGMVGPIIELLRIRARSGEVTSAVDLWGTSWRLEDLAGSGVLDRANATLAFPEAGQALGSGSCNNFRGAVTIQGETITFGPLATTRKACAEAVMNQESRYLAALGEAKRFQVEEPFLYIYTAGRQQPLRFIREE